MDYRFASMSRKWFYLLAISVVLYSVPRLFATEVSMSSFVNTVKISGDLRLRAETFQFTEPDKTFRARQRFRLRVGTEFVLPNQVSAKLRLASGAGEQVSTNQTFDNLSNQKQLWIDQAFLSWKPLSQVTLAGGKMANPFWMPYSDDAAWDPDLNPEGFSQSFEFLLGGFSLFGNALQTMAKEDSAKTADRWMLGEQLGAEFKLPLQSRLRIAGAYYDWRYTNQGTFGTATVQEGNRRVGAATQLANKFGVADISGEFSAWIFSLPVSIQGTFLNNTKVLDILSPKENKGYQAGTIIGRAKVDHSWEAAYFYKKLETDVTVADVADSDFGNGGTNRKGNIFWLAYNPWEYLQLKGKYFLTEPVNKSITDGHSGKIGRFQFDIQTKF